MCRPCSRSFVPEAKSVLEELDLEDMVKIKTTSCLGEYDKSLVLQFQNKIYASMDKKDGRCSLWQHLTCPEDQEKEEYNMSFMSLKKVLPIMMAMLMAAAVLVPSAQAANVMEMNKEELSENEIEGLLLMREEEKLARDVYLTLGDTWELKPFFNIAKSEQKHMDEVGSLITKYEIEDPVKDDTRGVFTSPEMQKLYGELIAEGNKSRLDALKVGTMVEDLDIADLETLLKETDNDDIKIVYLNLVKGSRNHLRTFHMQVERSGGTYKAKYITEDMYKKIIESPNEQYEISDPNFKYEY